MLVWRGHSCRQTVRVRARLSKPALSDRPREGVEWVPKRAHFSNARSEASAGGRRTIYDEDLTVVVSGHG